MSHALYVSTAALFLVVPSLVASAWAKPYTPPPEDCGNEPRCSIVFGNGDTEIHRGSGRFTPSCPSGNCGPNRQWPGN